MADNSEVVECLNRILEHELAGVVRYSHYAFMVFGHNRIPICGWLREQARESLDHADEVGELITSLGAHPSLKIGTLLETEKHSVGDILNEGLDHEKKQLGMYKELLELAGQNIRIEEFARKLVCEEQDHISDMEKMLRSPK